MPTTDSNLTGTFIANTYQKLLQIDNQYGSVGTTAPFNVIDVKNSSRYNLLNGLGQSVGGLVIDQTGVGGFNGGLFLKNTSSGANNDGQASWTLQTSGDGSLNISRGSFDNYKLFLKQTGSVWIGYNNSSSPVADIAPYKLYVLDGIYSSDSTGSRSVTINTNTLTGPAITMNGPIPTITMNENASQFLVKQNGTNGFSPQVDFPIHFLTVDFDQTDNSNENLDANLNIPVSDWNVAVIGADWGNEGGGKPIVYTYINGSTWWVRADVIGDGDDDTVVSCQFLIVHKSVSSRFNNSLFGNSNGSNGSSSTKPFITYTGNTLHAAPGG